MGQEERCTVTFGGRSSEGKVLLETDVLLFRGEFRLSVPFKAMTAVTAQDGLLAVTFPEGMAVFELGAQAEKWARNILNPKSLLDKLGVKPGLRVSALGIDDPAFLADLQARTNDLSVGEAAPDSDIIFVAAGGPADLERLASLKSRIKRDGAVWAVYRKGQTAFKENDVLRGGLAAGLVDVKVVRFSDTHTATKFVIRKAER